MDYHAARKTIVTLKVLRMKVCLISDFHNPFDARIFYKQAISLQRNGYDVYYLFYHKDKEFIYKDQKIVFDSEVFTNIDGIKLKRLQMNRSLLKIPVVGYFIFAFLLKRKFIESAISVNAQIYHCHDHKIALSAFLAIIKKFKQLSKEKKYIFDVHEYYPGQIKDQYGKKIKYYIFKFWMHRMDKKAVRVINQFITVSEASRIHYLNLNRNIKIDRITNVASKRIFAFDKQKIVKNKNFLLCHEGNLNFDRGLKDLVEVLKKFKRDNINIKLKVIGIIPAKEQRWLQQQIEEFGLQDSLIIRGWVSYNHVGQEIQECHVGLVTMKPLFNNIFSISNKFFNYLLYGLPVVTVKTPEMERIIDENECGLVYGLNNEAQLYQSILKLYKDKKLYSRFSENAFLATERYFNWEKMEKKLLTIYKNLYE